MKKLILTFLIIVVTYGCNNDETNETEITPVLIGKAELFGNGEEGIDQSNLIITNTEDWNVIIEQMDSVNNPSNNFTEIEIDFSQFQVIAIFDEIRSSGDRTIFVTRIVEEKNEIKVYISYNYNGDMRPQIVIQSFHIVKIKRNEKPIIFLDEA